jgi:hypothetical protein
VVGGSRVGTDRTVVAVGGEGAAAGKGGRRGG